MQMCSAQEIFVKALSGEDIKVWRQTPTEEKTVIAFMLAVCDEDAQTLFDEDDLQDVLETFDQRHIDGAVLYILEISGIIEPKKPQES